MKISKRETLHKILGLTLELQNFSTTTLARRDTTAKLPSYKDPRSIEICENQGWYNSDTRYIIKIQINILSLGSNHTSRVST